MLDFPIVGGLFSEGLETFRTSDSCERENAASRDKDFTGYINHSGKVAIQPAKRVCERFQEGFARVRVHNMDQWGFIDKTGNLICEMKYKNVGDFHEGLALVGEADKWGYINQSDKYVWSSEVPIDLEQQNSTFAGFSIFRDVDDRDENYPQGFEIRFFEPVRH